MSPPSLDGAYTNIVLVLQWSTETKNKLQLARYKKTGNYQFSMSLAYDACDRVGHKHSIRICRSIYIYASTKNLCKFINISPVNVMIIRPHFFGCTENDNNSNITECISSLIYQHILNHLSRHRKIWIIHF